MNADALLGWHSNDTTETGPAEQSTSSFCSAFARALAVEDAE